MLGFVDNKRHYVNLILQHIKESLEEVMFKSVNMWEELLSFVGGKLEMPKCGFYVLKWEFDSNEKLLLKESKSTISFSSQGIRIDSTRLQTKEALTYLGVTSQPNGDQSAQAQVLIKKAEQIGQQLSSIHLSQYYAHTYSQCTINPKITYPLNRSSLSDKQLASI